MVERIYRDTSIVWTPEKLKAWAEERATGHQYSTPYGDVCCPTRIQQMSNKELSKRLIDHVTNRGGSTLKNGAWDMMVEAGIRLAKDNVLPFEKPATTGNDSDWLSPMEVNTAFLCIKKGDTGYLLEEYVKSVQNGRGVMLISNGFTGGNVDFFWVKPQGFCRNYDLVEVIDRDILKVKQDGADHQSNDGQRPTDE